MTLWATNPGSHTAADGTFKHRLLDTVRDIPHANRAFAVDGGDLAGVVRELNHLDRRVVALE